MKNRFVALVAAFLVLLVCGAAPVGKNGAQVARESSSGVERELVTYATHFLPFDPETKITIEKASETLPGFQGYKVHRRGRYEKLSADRLVYVSVDGKWFFAGETITNTDPRPVRGASD